ncbi:glutamine-hydrolyzing carbamoyl-phosphate synthase small subunit [Synechococcus sp. TAK9802]|uniref:glutamine-hydrolyzing carbamoyl-phosphate synthase small subunit n=1 Tax=Synechococcus sp. TAK9802 TaxID=1442558 RepID=UPI0016476466|nr:glutamine-hydrolyzing carbamoyl-phosphate synthase small subunit [Synechococcus sp. TAK9802]
MTCGGPSMPDSPSDKAYLVLADGTVLTGVGFGHRGTTIGEVVFNTGMTGYQEVLTDPSYAGQLVSFTYPELGNTGVNADDQEADRPHARGVIARQLAPVPSNWRCEQSLESWMQTHQLVGISGLDTRALVRHLREVGAMNGVISSDGQTPAQLLELLKQTPSMQGLNLADRVTTREPYQWNQACSVGFDQRLQRRSDAPFRVVAIDFGIKRAILDRLVAHGCDVTVLPADTDLETVRSHRPDGVFLSNGPGDPAAVTRGIALAKLLLEESDLPLFGICLGHQILGLALGGETFKLPYGHRGLNHPCGTTGQVEITSQNHGFALSADSLDSYVIDVTHFNLNDRTVAAIAHRQKPVFGVQYHPEASPGPHDADHHFARFVTLMADRR